MIDVQSLNPTPKRDCSEYGGNLMDLAPGDGSEAFCICKYGYAGENCELKVQKQSSSSILESEELKKWSQNLQVPGMFDLMDAIERSTEAITDHVTKVTLDY